MISCAKGKEEKLIHPLKAEDTIKVIEETESVSTPLYSGNFLDEIGKTTTKELPILEKTNFDGFIEAEDY